MTDKKITQLDNASADVVIVDIVPIVTDLSTIPVTKYTTISGIIYNADFAIDQTIAPVTGVQSLRDYLSMIAYIFKSMTGGANWYTSQSYKQATTGVAGIAEIATAAEVNTGTSDVVVVSPNALIDSNFGIRTMVFGLNRTTPLASGDACYQRIPPHMTGMDLTAVRASVGDGAAGSSSSGIPTFQVRNVTDSNQMLTTNLSVDATEYTSATALTAAVINTSKDDVVTDDLIEVKCVIAGTGATHATVQADFRLP